MGESIFERASDVISGEIAREIRHPPADVDIEAASRGTAENLVKAALATGKADDVRVAAMSRFAAGNSADFVARVETALSLVVKVDLSESIVAEAVLLQRIAADSTLPAALRAAFPEVLAVDAEAPVFGYVMEDFDGFTPISKLLADPEQHELAADALATAWDTLLEPTYQATLRSRLAHNLHADYFERARERLLVLAGRGLIPEADEMFCVDRGNGDVREFAGGWSALLDHAGRELEATRPGFGTWVHGDPNPENILCRRTEDGELQIKLLDPKDWWIGDYIFDLAKILHYVRVTSPVESRSLAAELITVDGCPIIRYDASELPRTKFEEQLLSRASAFASGAASPPDSRWDQRLKLAEAANLLGIVGPRIARAETEGDDRNRHLALIALGEGSMLAAGACAAATA